MICRIAELIVEVPNAGGLAPRCRDYVYNGENSADVIIRTDLYREEKYGSSAPAATVAYMESAYQFYKELVNYNGLYLHSSAVVVENKAYLFSGSSGIGKSTHTRMWQKKFGNNAQIINDDKPALRRMKDRWYAYGTPWCGKDGINQNRKVPLVGICFLKQAPENSIRKLTSQEAMQYILSQTLYKFENPDMLDKMLTSLDMLVREIPVYELKNRPEPEAAQLSHDTMCRAAKELGL